MRRKSGRVFAVFRDGVLLLCILFLGLLIAAKLETVNTARYQGTFRAVDGDTLAMGAERFRLLGIDAPELDQACQRSGGDWPCGREARNFMAELLQHEQVVCEGHARDRYDRRLVHCRVGENDVGAAMVRAGLALATEYFLFSREEQQAKAEKAGLWAGGFDNPKDWRRMKQMSDADVSSGDLLSTIRNLMGWQ